jgi:hypothetical protein
VPALASAADAPTLLGNRFFTFVAYVRVNQIEAGRDKSIGDDESKENTVEAVRAMRDALERGFPGASMTWAFSWRALEDERQNYCDIRTQVVAYHKKYGDEITFLPGGYFAPMYNTRAQINRDLHDGLKRVSDMVGGGYHPKSVVAGFLPAENMRYLDQQEGIHVCQGTIWSQYGIDNGDGDGSVSYPYYPSREHYCKPAQGHDDFIDCVTLDGWTCDFLAARRAGFAGGFNSRMGLGPIETVRNLGPEKGLRQQLATTAVHFDDGFKSNGFAWVTAIWEVSLLTQIRAQAITDYGIAVRKRWPEAKCISEGQFGELWRAHYRDNAAWDYRFAQRGTGIGGSDADQEIRWFMNRDFRLALLHNWKTHEPERVIDFTRYDLKAEEPKDLGRNWSLMNRLNQKGLRPQDKPLLLADLSAADRALIGKHYPELVSASPRLTRLFILSGQSNMSNLNPDDSFTPTLKKAFPNDELIVVQHAAGGVPIRAWYKGWKAPQGVVFPKEPSPKPGNYYDAMMVKVRKAIEGKKIDTVVFVWMQGERDAMEGISAVYADSLQGLIRQLRDDLHRPEMPVVIGRLSDHLNGNKHWDAVRTAQEKVAASDPKAAWIDTDDLNGPKNDLHLTKEGYLELGRRFAAKAIYLVSPANAPKGSVSAQSK